MKVSIASTEHPLKLSVSGDPIFLDIDCTQINPRYAEYKNMEPYQVKEELAYLFELGIEHSKLSYEQREVFMNGCNKYSNRSVSR